MGDPAVDLPKARPDDRRASTAIRTPSFWGFQAGVQRFPFYQIALVYSMTYYDARPSAYNGLFDPVDNSPRPSYWAFDAWRSLCALKSAVSARVDDASGQVSSVASCDGVRFAVLVVRITGDLNQTATCGISVDLGGVRCEELSVKTLDSRHAFQARPAALRSGKLYLSLEPWALALVEGRLVEIEGIGTGR